MRPRGRTGFWFMDAHYKPLVTNYMEQQRIQKHVQKPMQKHVQNIFASNCDKPLITKLNVLKLEAYHSLMQKKFSSVFTCVSAPCNLSLKHKTCLNRCPSSSESHKTNAKFFLFFSSQVFYFEHNSL